MKMICLRTCTLVPIDFSENVRLKRRLNKIKLNKRTNLGIDFEIDN